MDYFKIEQSNNIEAVQSTHNQTIDLKQRHSTNQINEQDNSEQQKGSNELDSYAKNESHLQHHHRSFSMPHKKQHNEPKSHTQQITYSSSKYLEVESCIEHLNEKHDASFTKHSNEMQNMFDNKNEISSSNIKALTEFKITLTTDTITAEELMQNKPVSGEKPRNIAMTRKSENSFKDHNLEHLKDNPMFQKSCEASQLLHRSECNMMDDNNTQKSIICFNQDVPYVVDENEIAENIANGRNESDEKNNHMTKKQLQILMSRSCGEPNSKCSLENILINNYDHVRVKTRMHEVNVDATNNRFFFGNPNVSERNNTTNNLIKDNCSLKTMQVIETTTDKVEVKTPDKIRFEEIENKLEEMFAGIEDEQLVHPSNSKNNSHTRSTKIEDELDDMKLHAVTKEIIRDETLIAKVCYKNENELNLPINSSHLTKAAKKSTESYIHETNKIESEKAILTTVIDAQKFQNTMAPHRRLSAGIDHVLFRSSLESRTDSNPNKKKQQNDKETTPNRNKTKKNSKNSAENKREITYSKSFFSNNKRKQFKTDSQAAATRQKQPTVKHRSIHTISLDNDNEPEERTQQARELDNKIRSPFILVKHNGTVTVVNAPTIDDLNEKNTKAKKTGTFVHERKNVRGCHSSTLSNRYDAETADSTWMCVFCKQGPHKKGLGDLFGPYIISIDCEEYQSAIDVYTHDSAALFIKRRRIEPSLVNEKVIKKHKLF